MKVFKNPLNKKEFVNQYGETMTMVMSSDANMWIHHNDCNEDFEKLSIFTTNFILNAEELPENKFEIDLVYQEESPTPPITPPTPTIPQESVEKKKL